MRPSFTQYLARRAMAFVSVVVLPLTLSAQTMANAPLTAAAVRDARARSNAAIAARDTATLTALVSPSYHSVSSRNAHSDGRRNEADRWRQQFTAHADVNYVRTPHDVRVFKPWEMADERGNWVGTWTEPDGQVTIRGRYTAKWRRIAGVWLLEAEVFTPTSCVGSSYCTRPPEQPK